MWVLTAARLCAVATGTSEFQETLVFFVEREPSDCELGLCLDGPGCKRRMTPWRSVFHALMLGVCGGHNSLIERVKGAQNAKDTTLEKSRSMN